MSLVCSISGVPPEEPVLSKNGYIFEKRLIIKEIERTNKCPITGIELTVEDLSPINSTTAIKPRPITAASIPGLLSLFQNEWDSLMHETCVMKTHLQTVRNQLSQCLYQHDAATRVIARTLRERDSARSKISQLQHQLAAGDSATGVEKGEIGLDEAILTAMQDLSRELLSKRRKRQVTGTLKPETMKTMKCFGDFPLHAATNKGVRCCEIDPKNPRRIVSGGNDGSIVVFDTHTKKTVNKLLGHMKQVNKAKIHPNKSFIVSCSEDKTIRVWSNSSPDDPYVCSHVIRKHGAAVHDISLHPLDNYFVSTSSDKSWALHELDSGRCLRTSKDLPCTYRCLNFHPDGLILGGGGEDGSIHIWDIKAGAFRAALTGHDGPINGMSFSENGYYMATASDDGTVRLWDLRKSLSFQTIVVNENGPVSNVNFDYSGQYVAVAANNLSIYHFESRANVSQSVLLTDHKEIVTDACFGPNAEFLVSASMERVVRIWKPQEAEA